jgi:4'-phosphopantetheinyl transferase
LAAQAGGSWRDYVLSAPENAPPALLPYPSCAKHKHLHISLSHSSDYLACAVSTRPIGIDIECTTMARDWEAMSPFVLNKDELASVRDLPASERRAQFYARWTLKEAWIKQDSTTTSMQAVPCFPCDNANALGVVISTSRWVLAVTQVQVANLILSSALEDHMAPRSWQVSGPPCTHK